jgi:hypothetical protein
VRPEAIPIVTVADVVGDHLAGLRAGAEIAPSAAPRLRLVPPRRDGAAR